MPTTSVNDAPKPLREFLSDEFPAFRTKRGKLDIQRLACALGVSNETLYRALRLDWMSVRVAEHIMAFSVHEASKRSQYRPDIKPIKREDLIPFLFG